MHPPVFVRQVRFSLVRLSPETARPWRAHGSRVCVVDGVDDHSRLRPRRRPLCKRHYTTRWNALICRVADVLAWSASGQAEFREAVPTQQTDKISENPPRRVSAVLSLAWSEPTGTDKIIETPAP